MQWSLVPAWLDCWRRLLEAAADNPRLSQSFYLVMHMLKPPMAMFTPRVLAAVLFWKQPTQPIRQEYLGLPIQPGGVEARAEEQEPVGAAQRL